MMIQLSKNGKLIFVQFSAILFMRNRSFFKGSVIGMVGKTNIVVDQTPKEILEALSTATNGKKEAPKEEKK